MASSKSGEPFNVLDLPQIYEKPSYEQLVDVLKNLKVKPSSWNGQKETQAEDGKAVSGYLSQIVSSELKWFSRGADEDTAMDRREKIWDEASKRIAERCGRSAMPAMTRLWTIPPSTGSPAFQLKIREPSLTGDNLGFKTWGTAFTMAKQLDSLGTAHLNHILMERQTRSVFELGSGTGLVGLAAAFIWRCPVTLTDLPEICPNLATNIEENRSMIWRRGGRADYDELDWKKVQPSLSRYDIIIAADSLYDDEHPKLVAKMISHYQKCNDTSRAIVAVPLRDEHTEKLTKKLRACLKTFCFDMVTEGEWTCYDDWQQQDEAEGVRCWWAIFKRCNIEVCYACELYRRVREL